MLCCVVEKHSAYENQFYLLCLFEQLSWHCFLLYATYFSISSNAVYWIWCL